jgi:hypothetical protein
MPVGRPKQDRRLQICQEVGLSCDECIRDSASSLAAIAGHLSTSQVRSLFHAMFPESNCRINAGMFVELIQIECAPAPRRAPAAVTVMPAPIFAVA